MASDFTGAGSLHQRIRPSTGAGRGSASRRITATVCLAVAASFLVPATPAHADPEAEAKKKLTRLNEQVEQMVEKYNQVGEKLKVAKKKYQATQKAGQEELATYNALQAKVSQMAADAYKAGDTGDVAGFVGSDDPQAVLDQAAVFTHLSRNRTSELAQFLSSAQRLRREQAQAKAAYDEVAGQAKDLRKKKAVLDKAVKKQRALVAKYDPPSAGGIGGTYNGPASGSARVALDFAYAQLGKPYSYGATGPDSYDCSGLTMRAWGAAGVNVTRTTNSQYAATKRVDRSNLQPGDLVFFNGLGHMGMYVGGGKMIHAPRTGKNVEIVPINSGYYDSNYYGAGRP